MPAQNLHIPLRYLQSIKRPDLIPEHYRKDAAALKDRRTYIMDDKFGLDEVIFLKKIALAEYKAKVPDTSAIYSLMVRVEKSRALEKSNATAASSKDFSPDSILVKDIKDVPDALKILVSKTSDRCWIFKCGKNYRELAYLLVNAGYEPPSRHQEAHVALHLAFLDSDDKPHTDVVWISVSDFRRVSSAKTAKVRVVQDEADDDDGETSVRETTTVFEAVPLTQLLAAKDIMLADPILMEQYAEAVELWGAMTGRCGKEFRSRAGAQGVVLKTEDEDSFWWGRNKTMPLTYVADQEAGEVISHRLVLDDTKEERRDDYWNEYGWHTSDKDHRNEFRSYWGVDKPMANLPVKTVVRVFNLDGDKFLRVHVLDVEPAIYEDNIREKLVLPESDLDFIDLLIGSAEVKTRDIIMGKTGGIIILGSGDPGVGKTLTAEVYAQHAKKPLYSVQCSQLGTDEEELEKRLTKVLRRADRWKCIVLLDEADVYVRERGVDIKHNAIVGVFLRVLEYYRGIMFLTTNKPDNIDDAILSRCTAHIHYKRHEGDLLKRLWTVLSTQYQVKLSDDDVAELIKIFGSLAGRSIKNALKLARFQAKHKKKAASVESLRSVMKYLDVKEVGP